MKILSILFSLTFLLLAPIQNQASAEPTPPDRFLVWDDYTDPDGVGFFLYWAMEFEPEPRVYDNTRRLDVLRPDPEMIVVLTVKPDVRSSVCFKLTAYDAVGNESPFSNEDCGWFGIAEPLNFRAAPE